MFKKLLMDCLTGKDGTTFDQGRVLGFLIVIAFLLFTLIDVIETHTFEYEQFGMGIAAVIAAIGLNLKLKETTEPDKKE